MDSNVRTGSACIRNRATSVPVSVSEYDLAMD